MIAEKQIAKSGYTLEISLEKNALTGILRSSNKKYWIFMCRNTIKEMLNDALIIIRDNQMSGKYITNEG